MTNAALSARGQSPAMGEKPPKRPERPADFSPQIALPRDPRRDHGIPASSRNVEGLILDQFCSGRNNWLTWASNETITEATGLTRRQINRGFKFARILRFRSARKFRDWLDTVGNPVYGLSWPPDMRRPKRVIVFVRRLRSEIPKPSGRSGSAGPTTPLLTPRRCLRRAPMGAFERHRAVPFHPIRTLGMER
jgi:hypothetical protein